MTSGGGAVAGRPMGHISSLEGVRGIAVAVVVLVHLYAPIFSGGNSGVDLFFVLSGFLITKLLYEERTRSGDFSLGNFYVRRVFRILPALFVMLTCMLVASFSVLSDIGSNLRRNIAWSALSVGNLWPLVNGYETRGPLAHTWSLGLEEQFYLVWPMVLAIVPIAFRRTRRFAGWVAGAALLSILIGRVLVVGVLHYPHWGSIPLLNFDGLALGCLIGIFAHGDMRGVGNRLPTWPAALGLSVIAVDLFAARYYVGHDPYVIRTLVLRVAAGAIVLVLVTRPDNALVPLLRLRPLVFLGRISYPLYLWHVPIFEILSTDRHPDVPRAVLVPFKLAASFAAAMASYRFVEQPMLRRGRALVAARQQRVLLSATDERRVLP